MLLERKRFIASLTELVFWWILVIKLTKWKESSRVFPPWTWKRKFVVYYYKIIQQVSIDLVTVPFYLHLSSARFVIMPGLCVLYFGCFVSFHCFIRSPPPPPAEYIERFSGATGGRRLNEGHFPAGVQLGLGPCYKQGGKNSRSARPIRNSRASA